MTWNHTDKNLANKQNNLQKMKYSYEKKLDYCVCWCSSAAIIYFPCFGDRNVHACYVVLCTLLIQIYARARTATGAEKTLRCEHSKQAKQEQTERTKKVPTGRPKGESAVVALMIGVVTWICQDARGGCLRRRRCSIRTAWTKVKGEKKKRSSP